MKKVAVFPGSFDPFTIGHREIVERALPLFDEIIIAIGINSEKNALFSIDERIAQISRCFDNNRSVRVETYKGLTVDYCVQVGANFILRGLRTAADFEYEMAMAQNNRMLNPNIETIFLLSSPENIFINSTVVRDIIRNGGDTHKFIP